MPQMSPLSHPLFRSCCWTRPPLRWMQPANRLSRLPWTGSWCAVGWMMMSALMSEEVMLSHYFPLTLFASHTVCLSHCTALLPSTGRPHQPGHCPPPLHHPQCRLHCGHVQRRGSGAWQPRAADGSRGGRVVCQAGQGAGLCLCPLSKTLPWPTDSQYSPHSSSAAGHRDIVIHLEAIH